MLRVPVVNARRLAVRNQRLSGPRRPRTELLETCHALRCLQLDPTAVVARSHLLVLFSRHGAFDERRLERLAYGERRLFEYWAHEASLVLAEDLPLHRWEMRTWPWPSHVSHFTGELPLAAPLPWQVSHSESFGTSISTA